jgi:hypothetical protein
MAWLDDRVWCHPKVTDLTDEAFRAYINGIAYSSGFDTNGLLTVGQQRQIGATSKTRRELVAASLWDDIDGKGVRVHDWHEHNAKRDEKRRQDRERKRRQREREAGDVTRTVTPDVTHHVTADVTADVTRDVSRDKQRDRRTLTGDGVKEELEPPAAANVQSAAAAKTIERLQAIGLELLEVQHGDPPPTFNLIDAWLDLADHEARDNPAGFILAGVRSGRPPSPRVRAESPDPVGRRRSFVEENGWRLAADHLDDELAAMGADEGERVGLLELAADLRRGAAA